MKENIDSQQKEGQIPKIIHYCWFGGAPIPDSLQKCIDSWKLLDGYKIMRWDESNCSFDENEFVKKTYQEKQLGFIGDYYRLKAVYEYGGIYLDTDVKVCKSFDSLLNYKAFLNFIFDCSVGTAIIGAKPKNPLIKNLLDMYEATTFGNTTNGKLFEWKKNQLIVNGYATSNYYYTYYILKHYPEFQLNNKFQDLGNFVIFPKEYFEIGTLTGDHYAIHLCSGEWRIKNDGKKSMKDQVKQILTKWPYLYEKVQIMVRKRRYDGLKKDIPFYEYYLAQKEHRELPEL
ncbi:glycosyltransferase family 32 protein [Anaeromicropila herbilytica]|uniref:Mannosyltransferase n=1 Tax=Anaeromicropila herbilytica TaxID=2785025 RepID=A0A7R7EGY4_9FIRM|nr:glycosyltransferase [Anaeromicropila herbilytica]BCN29020.1 mannosyltransferase [Anaeromicropila herbilytica]